MAHLLLDICLTDIPKERIKEARNGKKYLKVEVGELREKDEHDNDSYVRIYINKADREAGVQTKYIGRGKTLAPRENSPANGNSPSASAGRAVNEDTDLPF